MSGPHAKKGYERICYMTREHHTYHTDDPAARWVSRGGQARYFCPICFAAGERPPKTWRRAEA